MVRRCLALALSVPYLAYPCAPAPPVGASVRIAEEEALIVWDAARGIEHFVRRADFESDAAGFGFLVPTPEVPELAEADDAVFERIEGLIRPRVEMRSVLRGVMPVALCLTPFLMLRAGSAGAPGDGLRIVKEQRVGGYDATVIEATDTGALAAWLDARGFAMRPELEGWLAPYVEGGFAITAFRIAREDGAAGKVATKAVRMTFATPQPMFPYREPSDQRAGDGGRASRLLRVHLVAPFRAEGGLEDGPWPGKLVYAKPLPDPAALLREVAPGGVAPGATWLNVMEDVSSPRPGTSDLRFSPSTSQTPVEPPPVIVDRPWYLPLPIDLLFLAAGAAWFVRRRRRRRLHTS